MDGFVKLDRKILDHRIWTNVAEVRLFLYLILQAHHGREPLRIGEVTIQRGQYLRSYRQLQEDLMYIENNQVKKYSLDKLKRIIVHLKSEIQADETRLGTLFTVLKYNQYQDSEVQKLEASNTSRTVPEHLPNNNKKDKNNLLPTEVNITPPKKAKTEYHADSQKVVGFLWQELKAKGVTGLPQTQFWIDRRCASNMLERHPAQEIMSAISWLLSADFYGPRINSMKAVEKNLPLYQRRGELVAQKKPAGTQVSGSKILLGHERPPDSGDKL